MPTMSGDNSFAENNVSASEPTLASEYALRVALQTMKERCISLQQRLSIVEEENLTIKGKLCSDGGSPRDLRNYQSQSGQQTEGEALREKLTEVTKQKFQLTEHIAMVAKENRQLWSRLSQLTKDKETKVPPKKSVEQASPTNCQKLIRSETFTQHSPNVLIRPRPVNPAGMGAVGSSGDDYSMEDVSLKNFTDYLDDKYGACDRQGAIRPRTPSPSTLDFGYLNEDVSRAGGDITQDLKTYSAGMRDMKGELVKQQNELKTLLGAIKARKVVPECTECHKRQQKPEMADKGLETDECVREKQTNNSSMPRKDHKEIDSYDGSSHINFVEEKRLADERDKMCPFCGKVYTSATTFDVFREHVETHFVDQTTEIDPNSIETNFEFISHTVGNF